MVLDLWMNLASKSAVQIAILVAKFIVIPLNIPIQDADIDTLKINLEQALAQVWQGNIENDGYNKLLLSANINIRQIVIIRAYGKYLRQLGLGYSEEYFQQALINYPSIVHGLINLFESRFALTSRDISERELATDEIKAELIYKR